MCELNSTVRPVVAHVVQQLHHVHALPRVHAVERLVEQQHGRVVDQGRGDPGALAHALGVGVDPPVLGVGHLDQLERPPGRRRRVGQPVQLGAGEHELPAGEEPVHRLPLADQCRVPVDGRVAPGRLGRRPSPHPATGPGTRPSCAARGLAGAVGPEQPGDAGAQRHRDVVDRDHVAVPPWRPRARRVARSVIRLDLPVPERAAASHARRRSSATRDQRRRAGRTGRPAGSPDSNSQSPTPLDQRHRADQAPASCPPVVAADRVASTPTTGVVTRNTATTTRPPPRAGPDSDATSRAMRRR